MTADHASDRELVTRYLDRGDGAAFHELYRRHVPLLYAVAMRLTGAASDAEDVVHDTWLRAIGALPTFEWRAALRTWLTAILVNRARELRRERERVVSLEELPDLLPALSVDDAVPRAIDPVDLARAVAAMPLRYREVFVLYDIEGFMHHEIADMLGIATGTSKSHLNRGRHWLRRALTESPREDAL